MEQGTLLAIHVSPTATGRMESLPEVRAVPGRGLEGDRYFTGEGSFSKTPGTGRQVTLIAIEMLDWLEREQGIRLKASESRRNLVTGGVSLNDLVGKIFHVGAVRLKGVRLAEPCTHLERLTVPGVQQGLVHRAGLRAEILDGGVVRVGDVVGSASTSEERACP